MLVELAVTDLGVIAELSLVLDEGMTALTGETGAGKTMLVEAVELLVGGRADGTVVRAGAGEATIEGRFVQGDEEVVLRRVVPREGRSRAYVDGRLATAGELAAQGARLVDLHGQHAHQSLLSGPVQRAALDRFGAIDLTPLTTARKELAAIEEQLAALGGDDRERARELDLLRFQADEIDAAGVSGPDEDERLDAEENLLADAVAHREAAGAAAAQLSTDGGAGEAVAAAVGALEGREPFAALEARLRGIAADLTDLVSELRSLGESIEDDPARLEVLRERRGVLAGLRRKYGDDLAEVLAFREGLQRRLDELEGRQEAAARLDGERARASEAVAIAEQEVGRARREAAPRLAEAVRVNLAELGLERARVDIEVGADPGDDVTFLFAANPGSTPAPLAKVASGGELARTMLALRLVLTEAPETLVFDEVDAGIGGTAALAVGRALAALGADHQVLVVTHLAQVASHADHQLVVVKETTGAQTFTSIRPVEGEARSVEVARMLSGSPDSEVAVGHAEELLAEAAVARER